MLKWISFVLLTLSFSSFALTDAEIAANNKKDFEALKAYPEISSNIEKVVGPGMRDTLIKQIAQRYEHIEMMKVVRKYVEAEQEKDRATMLKKKAIVLRDDLEVEKEVWRRILGKKQANPAIPNEEKREALVEAITGESVLRSLTESHRATIAADLAKLEKERAEAEAKLSGVREEARAKEQKRRDEGTLATVDQDFKSIMNKLAQRRNGTTFGERSDLFKKPAAEVQGVPEQAVSTAVLPSGSEIREQIRRELAEERAAKARASEPQAVEPAKEEVHK